MAKRIEFEQDNLSQEMVVLMVQSAFGNLPDDDGFKPRMKFLPEHSDGDDYAFLDVTFNEMYYVPKQQSLYSLMRFLYEEAYKDGSFDGKRTLRSQIIDAVSTLRSFGIKSIMD